MAWGERHDPVVEVPTSVLRGHTDLAAAVSAFIEHPTTGRQAAMALALAKAKN